ncbi:MAG: hypothetical protein Q8O92_14395 [Candidatus Latescibacter sp.]|nr:hypothetical protein [Candidatus Latescibacter sp.]
MQSSQVVTHLARRVLVSFLLTFIIARVKEVIGSVPVWTLSSSFRPHSG